MKVELSWEERHLVEELINDELLEMEYVQSPYCGNVDREATLRAIYEKVRTDQ